jgi:putative tricarboxylic transport membrane protein
MTAILRPQRSARHLAFGQRPSGLAIPPFPARAVAKLRSLVDKVIDSTVNNPIEAVAQWKDGALRPLCVFDNKQLQQTEKIADGMSWSEIPTCKSQGIDVEYLMLRGVFTTPGAAPDQVAYYIDVLKKVRETPEWKALMNEGAFNQTFMTGADFAKWLSGEESRHRQLMQEAGFLAGN